MSVPKGRIAAIKGTKDILPQEVRKWQRAEAQAKKVFELYGYREIRTPVFEATELFEKGTGQTSDVVTKEMYTFVDKGGRSLTLRPEYTPSIVRSIIENRLHLKPQPLRFYFIGPMFRYDKPQKGRFRQFHQIDIEVFGEENPAIDAEIVEMADFLCGSLGVKERRILVNSVGCRQCRPEYHKELKAIAEKHRDNLCDDCQRKIDTNPLRIFDCKVETCRELAQEFPKITDYLCPECDEHFRQFRTYLDLYAIEYRIDPLLVRGLDYYTKTTFEIISPKLGAQDSILGGGRYDDMMKDFGGPDICGIGFAVGMERLLSLVPPDEKPDIFTYVVMIGEEAKKVGMDLARAIRRTGMECLIEYKDRNLRNQMSRADKLGATWVVIIGENEVAKKEYQLKKMESGEQLSCTRQGLLKVLSESEHE
jgi:histidyl-tRNA synthetase